jgi:hypothetical protein
VPERAAVYDAALRATFDVGPSLVVLLHPRLLPRTAGLEGGQPLSSKLAAALQARGIVQGTCQPSTPAADTTTPAPPPRAPTCEARAPGYLVRFSDVLRLSRDSVEVFVEAERYDTPSSGTHSPFRFEKAYQLVGAGSAWRVARVGRVTER